MIIELSYCRCRTFKGKFQSGGYISKCIYRIAKKNSQEKLVCTYRNFRSQTILLIFSVKKGLPKTNVGFRQTHRYLIQFGNEFMKKSSNWSRYVVAMAFCAVLLGCYAVIFDV